MQIAVNKAHFPVTVLGPGRRLCIWLQGCSIGCTGCISQDTWEADPGRLIAVEALLDWCRKVTGSVLDGITVSGGEPFDQPQALESLLQGLHEWRTAERLDFDILCYSGYPLRLLKHRHAAALSLLDALVPEPFVEALPAVQRWRGSDNQPLVSLSPRGDARYGGGTGEAVDARLQFRVDAERIWYIGIPRRGDMERVEERCRSRGLDFKNVSWRA